MADWSKPGLTDTYANFLTYIAARDTDLAAGMDPAKVTVTNPPANAIRWNSANGYWEFWNGTAWGVLAATYNVVAAQAVKLKTAVAIAVSGDVAGSASFDGNAGISIAATLPTVNANPGVAGNATTVPVVTTNAKGQVTAVSQTAISFPAVPVTSVFGRTGAVTLASSDVTGALGYSPPQPGGSGASGTWPISVTGNAATASKLVSTAGAGTYNWAGQSGQPSWLWGSNDGANFYVWNPANFSVNYATTAGSANTATWSGWDNLGGDGATAWHLVSWNISGGVARPQLSSNCNCNCNCGC